MLQANALCNGCSWVLHFFELPGPRTSARVLRHARSDLPLAVDAGALAIELE